MNDQRIKLLVVGVNSLVGRRLQTQMSTPAYLSEFETHFTSRIHKNAQCLAFDLTQPQKFKPDLRFDAAIICCPIWLITDAVILALKAAGVGRIVAFSSTSIFTKSDSDSDDEREVVQKLLDGEARLIASCLAHELSFCVLRPTLIYDLGRDHNISLIAKTIDRLGVFFVCGKADGLRQPVHANDLAIAAIEALMCEVAHNRDYNLSGGETLTYRQMVARIFTIKGLKSRIFALPEFAWRLGFGALNLIRPKHKSRLNVQMALRMNADLVFDHADATRDFAFAPKGFLP